MRKKFVYGGWFVAGMPIGAAVFACCVARGVLELEYKVKVIDLAQLGATIFLAFYIPLALETYRDRRKYAQEIIIDHIRSLLAGLQSVNDYLSKSAGVSPSPDITCMRVRTGFKTANLKMASLSSRLPRECGENCRDQLSKFRRTYNAYYDAVTDGSLYGNGLVTWDLWKRQEFAFNVLRDAEIDLIRFINDTGLR